MYKYKYINTGSSPKYTQTLAGLIENINPLFDPFDGKLDIQNILPALEVCKDFAEEKLCEDC